MYQNNFQKKNEIWGPGTPKYEILKILLFFEFFFPLSKCIVSKQFSKKKLKLRGQGPQKSEIVEKNFFPKNQISTEVTLYQNTFQKKKLKLMGQGPQKMNFGKFCSFIQFFPLK